MKRLIVKLATLFIVMVTVVGPTRAGIWGFGGSNNAASFGETALVELSVQDVPNFIDFAGTSLNRLQMVTVSGKSSRHPDMEKLAIFWCRDGLPIALWREQEFNLPEGITADIYISPLPNDPRASKAAASVATRIYLELSLARVLFRSVYLDDKDFYVVEDAMQGENFYSKSASQGRPLDPGLMLLLSSASGTKADYLEFSPSAY